MTRPISRRSLCRGLALLPVGAAFVAQPARAFFERDAYDVIVVRGRRGTRRGAHRR